MKKIALALGIVSVIGFAVGIGLIADARENFQAIPIAEPSGFSQQVRLAGASGDGFASQVEISGDTAIVYTFSGLVVFVRSGATWTQQAVLLPSDGLGSAVAIEGNTIVIGRTNTSIPPGEFQGAAYVFVRNGTTWTEHQRLIASDGANGDSFGSSVTIDGGTIIIGAGGDDIGGNTNQGSAYVFVRNGGIWTEQAKLTASDGGLNHGFGQRVSIDEDTLAISRSLATGMDMQREKPVYVFVRNGTTWSEQQRLSVCEMSGPPPGIVCRFGGAISVSGDTLAIGNDWLNVAANQIQGGVYVFTRNGTVWSQQQRITAADGLAGDHYGFSVALQNDLLIVGSHGNGEVRPGSVYTYERSGSTWALSQPRIQVAPSAVNNLLGWSVSVSGNRFIVAATKDVTPSEGNIGAAYIFWNGVADPSPTPSPTPTISPSPTSSPSPTPTPAAGVSVSGRVTTPSGLGLRNAVVALINSQGIRQAATTSSFGVYSFANIAQGETYVISVSSKRYRFAALSIPINSGMTNVDFVGLE